MPKSYCLSYLVDFSAEIAAIEIRHDEGHIKTHYGNAVDFQAFFGHLEL